MSMIDIIIYEFLSMNFFKTCIILGIGIIIFLICPILLYRFLRNIYANISLTLILTSISSLPLITYIFIAVKTIYIILSQ
ncbi:putative membrane protein [Clostridium baratii str. Sullivan]|uniref:Putative membrane protein n=1 Tax=Clostridium baratii str. Sullivan TaxID=1415775 RepID=A0A0A7FVU2_9CLOT|nr:putative membrane protein [Clostridium baratii str. Sullivan]